MESIRKWFYRPKRDDPSLLAQFFYADEALNLVAAELDSFDGRKDPERCTALVNHLRQCQDKVLTICNRIMDDVIPTERANRDFRVKFPDDVMQENLAGQLWFGAECLAAGSSIMNREGESSAMRPLAKALTKSLENVRNLLREQCLRGNTSNNSLSSMNEVFSERLQEALKIFDRLFAEFELSYVSAMVPVKSTKEYELQQLVVVLFSETLQRALEMKLLTQEMVDDYDPALMFTIPRLAIVSGLLIFPDGPLCLDRTPADMSEMFRPFRTLLHKIRELLWTLNNKELFTLEKLLCSSEEPGDFRTAGHSIDIHDDAESVTTGHTPSYPTVPDLDDFVTRFYIDYPNCKQFVTDFYANASSRTAETEVQDYSCKTHISASGKKKQKAGSHEIIPSWDSTEESEDETEWVGETSECETVITEVYNEAVPGIETEENASSVESDSKTLVSLPEDSPLQAASVRECLVSNQLGTREMLVFGEHVAIEESASSCNASHSDFHDEGNLSPADSETLESNSPLPSSATIEIPASGFLLANQVGHESMLATIERISSPSGGGSLPDGDSGEALSVATATLSSLLLTSPNISPGGTCSRNNDNDVEEDSSIQSPLDSGVGTVVSCSDTGSFSDRSPDTATIRSSTADDKVSLPGGCVETIACNCTLTDKSASKCSVSANSDCSSVSQTVVITSNNNNICDNASDLACQDCLLPIQVENSDKEDLMSSDLERLKILNSKQGENTNFINVDCDTVLHSDVVNRTCTNQSQETSVLISKCSYDSTAVSDVSVFEENELPENSTRSFGRNNNSVRDAEHYKGVMKQLNVSRKDVMLSSADDRDEQVLSSIVVKVEDEGDKGGGEEWFGIASGDGHCTLCSSNEADESQEHRLTYAQNWASLLKQQSESMRVKSDFRSECVTSQSELKMPGRNEKAFSQTSSSVTKASSHSMAASHLGGSTLVMAPSQSGRSAYVPLGSSYSSTSSSSITASSDSCSMSSDTSSFNSECQDDEEIALAMQAAEIANRNEARAKFRSSEDLVHRLFVCIAGVADQLQTNFAGDLRHILKCVFLMSAASNASVSPEESSLTSESDTDVLRAVENAEEALSTGWESPVEVESPPPWIPDDKAPRCMSCEAVFTVVRRRHHCRNCGKVFCARCSSNSVPLPRYGHIKPVRVCNRCFLYQVTPFTLEELATRS